MEMEELSSTLSFPLYANEMKCDEKIFRSRRKSRSNTHTHTYNRKIRFIFRIYCLYNAHAGNGQAQLTSIIFDEFILFEIVSLST